MSSGRMQTPLLVLEKARSISLPVASNSSLRKTRAHATNGLPSARERLRVHPEADPALYRNDSLGKAGAVV
jgi:hypothetical protein